MKVLRAQHSRLTMIGWMLLLWLTWGLAVWSAQTSERLFLAYPPLTHATTSDRIFLIGTAPRQGNVTVNGQTISRNAAGHFAPRFPLQVGKNRFVLQYQDQTITTVVTRHLTQPEVPPGVVFRQDSLTPAVNVGHLPGEWVCLRAVSSPQTKVLARLGGETIRLQPLPTQAELPENAAVLTDQNQPQAIAASVYQGCTRFSQPGNLGQPEYEFTFKGQTLRQTALGQVKILAPSDLQVGQVAVPAGVARTGPGTDYSRLTPLPQGVMAAITGYEGEWVRLDYGGWIRQTELTIRSATAPPRSIIRSARAYQRPNATEIIFPLQVPVPLQVQQGREQFTLTLYNTIAQTDIIHLDDDPVIARLDWQPILPDQVQYVFQLKSGQPWGYQLRYEGTSLVLTLRHPPSLPDATKPLAGSKILLDPGHGGPEDLGARGPTGYPEKKVTLILAQLLQTELMQRGAQVVMTRTADVDVGLAERVSLIEQTQPTLALSLHYNALPDGGDALGTQGIGVFWYQPQAHGLAVFLHHYLVQTLKRPSYGIYWNNLALTRPAIAPSVLLELGFMINPDEYEWIVNPGEQRKLAQAIAEGVTQWLQRQSLNSLQSQVKPL